LGARKDPGAIEPGGLERRQEAGYRLYLEEGLDVAAEAATEGSGFDASARTFPPTVPIRILLKQSGPHKWREAHLKAKTNC